MSASPLGDLTRVGRTLPVSYETGLRLDNGGHVYCGACPASLYDLHVDATAFLNTTFPLMHGYWMPS